MEQGMSARVWTQLVRGVRPAVAVLAILVVIAIGVGPTVMVRLDTGDQKTVFMGFEIARKPMTEPARTALISVSNTEHQDEWVWCAQQVGSNHADVMVYRFYRGASAWVEENPSIAELVVRDLARYLRSSHAARGLPDCAVMIWSDVVNHGPGGPVLIEGWRTNERVLSYLSQNGYELNSTH